MDNKIHFFSLLDGCYGTDLPEIEGGFHMPKSKVSDWRIIKLEIKVWLR